jgi:hypothetical protein
MHSGAELNFGAIAQYLAISPIACILKILYNAISHRNDDPQLVAPATHFACHTFKSSKNMR